jgi:nucleoside-diphosphate-sugar epimerase
VKVLVAGASGALGVPLVRQLIARGHDVSGITRSIASGERLETAGARPIVVDALNRTALLEATAGLHTEAVVHVLTSLKKTPTSHADLAATDTLRIQGTANLVEAAQRMGARRFVVESFLKGYGFGDFGARLLHETDPFGQDGGGGFGVHVDALRSAESRTFRAHMEGIALRFGYLYGPGAGTDATVEMLRGHRFPVPVGGGGVNSWIYVEDAASAIVAALERGRPGTAYNVADDEPASWGDYLDCVAETFGAPKPLRVPGVVLRAMPYVHATMSNSCRLSNLLARSELGWEPMAPTFREGLELTKAAG